MTFQMVYNLIGFIVCVLQDGKYWHFMLEDLVCSLLMDLELGIK